MNTSKPGIYTTEFWKSLGTQLVALLVLLGVVDTNTGGDANAWIGNTVEHVVALGVLLASAWKYIESRRSQKVAEQESAAAVATAQIAGDSQVQAARAMGEP